MAVFSYEVFEPAERGALLTERSLSRVWRQWNDTGFAILSANRGERTPAGNKQALQQLKQRVRQAGYGFIPIVGVWAEEGEEPAEEPSILIPAARKAALTEGPVGSTRLGVPAGVEVDKDVILLRNLAIKWGQEFDQEAIVFSWPGGRTEVIDTKNSVGNVQFSFSKFRPREIAPAYSKMKGPGSFTFESWYWGAPPRSWVEALRRKGEGEVAFVARSINDSVMHPRRGKV